MSEYRRLTRRGALRLGAEALLAAGLWPGALRADGADAGDFHFLVVNDPHYVDRRCGDWLARVVRQMKGHPEKPDFCLVAGDLSEKGAAEALASVRDVLKSLGMPVRVVVGNHDYLTQNDRRAYEDLFPNSINYAFEHRGWQFVGLDTTEGQRARGTAVQPDTLRWLDDYLPKLDRKRPAVVFTHFPFGPWTPGRPTNAGELLDRLRDYNLRAVFSGHFHGFTERQVRGVALTTNRCCSFSRANHDGTKEKGYFLCHAHDGRVSRTCVEAPPA